jgi:DNA polymerase-4/DNA polymerase V
MERPIVLNDWPNAILHVDADAFFASVEQALNPSLKGKPVVVGKERGIATAVSYEAKAKGIKRGMMLWQIKKLCPQAILIQSDYEKYSLFSVRMFDIIRRFSPLVEEYSIDEAFVDLSGLRRLYHSSYENIGLKMKETIKQELGISVSIGISLTKVLAKIASKYKKPDGLTAITGRKIHLYLRNLPIDQVWGIGTNTTSYCAKLGIKTALEFATKPEEFIKRHFSKPFYEIWNELNGKKIYDINKEPKKDYKSISKEKTFIPTKNKETVYANLIENLENACFKARKYSLCTKRLIIFTKAQDYTYRACEIKLSFPTNYPEDIFPFIKESFEKIFDKEITYRQTGVVLLNLTSAKHKQLSLFEDTIRAEKIERLYSVFDELKVKFGKDILIHAAVLNKIEKEKKKQSLKIPLWDMEV